MESKIKKLIKLQNNPVAVIQSEILTEKVLQFKEKSWGCAIAMLAATSKGKISAFSNETTTCIGGRAGLDFEKYPLAWKKIFDRYLKNFFGKNRLKPEFQFENKKIATVREV